MYTFSNGENHKIVLLQTSIINEIEILFLPMYNCFYFDCEKRKIIYQLVAIATCENLFSLLTGNKKHYTLTGINIPYMLGFLMTSIE